MHTKSHIVIKINLELSILPEYNFLIFHPLLNFSLGTWFSYKEDLLRLLRGLPEGSERFIPRNPLATLSQPSGNPLATPSEQWKNAGKIGNWSNTRKAGAGGGWQRQGYWDENTGENENKVLYYASFLER